MLTVVVKQEEGKTLEETVEASIAEFERWFMLQGNQPLVRSERAILKTFLWMKTKGQADGT